MFFEELISQMEHNKYIFITECLLSLNSMVDDNKRSLSLADLMVPMLQTQYSRGWNPHSRTHTCHFYLPPAPTYSIHAPSPHEQTCQVQIQFMSGEGQNLTEKTCLHEIKGHFKGQKKVVLQMTIDSYDDTSELVELVRGYNLQASWTLGLDRVTRDSKFCQGDLVKFEEGLSGVVNYDYHSGSGDCVAKLHLPYGYATQLQFQIVSDYSNTSGGKGFFRDVIDSLAFCDVIDFFESSVD